MIDAYEIGIQLALQDDVSAGLEVISRGLAEVDRAIDATSAKLANLTSAEAAAGVAASGVTMRPTARSDGKAQESARELESGPATPASGEDVAPVSNVPSAAPASRQTEPASAGGQPSGVPSAASEPSKSAPIARTGQATLASVAPTADQASGPTMVHVEHSMEPVAPASPVRPVSEPERPSGRAAGGFGRPAQAPAVSNVQSVAPNQAEGAAPVREERVFTSAIAQTIAPSSAARRGESVAAPAVRTSEPASEPAGRGAAPWSGVEGRVLSPRPAADSEKAAAPQARQQDGSEGLTGTVMLDGHLVGYWLAEQMGKEASRPPSGTSFFDPRQTPAWTASGSL